VALVISRNTLHDSVKHIVDTTTVPPRHNPVPMTSIYDGYLAPNQPNGEPNMLPEDDYLRLKPAAKEHQVVLRIALMALMGCLALLAVLVVQATAATGTPASANGPNAPKPSGTIINGAHTAATASSPGLTIIIPAERSH
jgi:hypothetical protein